MNITMNVIASLAAIVGTLALAAGLGIGVVILVGSGAAWYAGTIYQKLANDPPRSDFDVVSVYDERDKVVIPSDLAAGVWHDFVTHCVQLAISTRYLTMSIERADGIAAAIATGAGDSLTEARKRQHDAIQRNALFSVKLVEKLLEERAPLNASWAKMRLELAEVVGRSQPVSNQFDEVWKSVKPWIGKSWQLESTELADMKRQMKRELSRAEPASALEREVLLDESWAEALRRLAASLRMLADPSLPFEVIARSSA